MQRNSAAHTVGIYLFDKVEVLDFAGPFEVFSTASRVRLNQQPDSIPPFRVLTIAKSLQPVIAGGGLSISPGYELVDHPPLDVFIIPGGIVSDELKQHKVVQWIARCAETALITASVCTGAFLLAKAGLLDRKPATTHWEDIPDLREMFPQVDVRERIRWVDTGRVVSSAGISAGIDMSLHLVERLENRALALDTARQMEFDWQEAGISV